MRRTTGFTLIELPKAVRQGFTLIELLVVVTIIVVLLAMLVPAMNKAIYQASLAMCGTNLKANATSVTTYAFDHKRYYPNRKMMGHGTDVDPIKITGANAVTDYDDRVQLKGYMQVGKTMLCPLQQAIDLEVDSSDDTFVYTGYAFWWGWRFAPQGIVRRGMYKVGDRMEFDVDPSTGTDIRTSSVLAADHLSTLRGPNDTFFYSTHPEKRQRHTPMYRQSGDNPWGAGLPGVGTGYVTISWSVTIGAPAPTFDLNFVMDNGGVVRVADFRTGAHQDRGLLAMPTFKNEYDRLVPINPVPPK